MRTIAILLLVCFAISCSSQKPKFKKEKVCSHEALRYLSHPLHKRKAVIKDHRLIQSLAGTTRDMQLCYEDFKQRTGIEEFNTCLVVGVDESGGMEFYNFSSKEAKLDTAFLKCAEAVTKSVPYANFGSNYILIQSYKFYVRDI